MIGHLYLVEELVDGEPDGEDDDGDEGDGHPAVPDLYRQVCQLRLKTMRT